MIHREFNHRQFTAPNRINQRRPIPTHIYPANLTLVEILGEPKTDHSRNGHRVVPSVYGHTGCVNTLDWDTTSDRLASAGDDTKICIWQPGRGPAQEASSTTTHALLRFGLTDTIASGHRANIFSVKWAPAHCNRLFTAAGDNQVRVFDLAASTGSETMRSWNHHPPESGACVKIYRCHTDRVKKIATEESGEVFLSASEDGTVRQHDLRSSHSCSSTPCPAPLLEYPGLSLYGLTISKARPYMLVVAGRSSYAFLHDRRMIRDSIINDWNIDIADSPDESATQCVRRFGVPKMNGDKGYIKNHVVSVKLGSTNPTELLVSYSGDRVYLFDTNGATNPIDVSSAPQLETTPASRRARPRVEHSPYAPIVSPLRSYAGHRNETTVKDVNFLFGESCVSSGSDDGHLFIWDKESTEIKGIFKADDSVVNVMQSHPSLPLVACSGIDPTIKILAPSIKIDSNEGGGNAVATTGEGANLVEQRDQIRQRNLDHADSAGAILDSVDSRAMFSLLVNHLRQLPPGALPNLAQDEGDDDQPTAEMVRRLMDGEVDEDECSIM